MHRIPSTPNLCESNCGLFDFMANTIGVKVLHPGGYEATDYLCTAANLTQNSTVLDLACGAGSTSFYLYQKYKCKVVGVDISETLINNAKRHLDKVGSSHKIQFEVANALELPYPDNSFDFVIAQAFFILINDKEKAIKEIYRVLKPNGCFGSLELSWFKTPSPMAYSELLNNTCTNFIPRTCLFEDWEIFFQSHNFNHIQTIKRPMTSGMMQMMKIEGFVNFMKIMLKMISNSKIRKRMMGVQNTFAKYKDYIGYGIYSYKK